jgi:hypothetical protein
MQVRDTVNFKHQYITNPTVSPESLVIAAAQQLTAALKGNIPRGNETMEGLTKVSKLFTRIAVAKQELAAAKAQQNKLRAHPAAGQTPLLPSLAAPAPRVVATVPRVEIPKADCHVTPKDCCIGGNIVASPRRRTSPQPNYISQDDNNAQPTPRYMTWATTRSIMREAMLSCITPHTPNFCCHPRANVPLQTSNDVVLRDGKLGPRKQRQATRILAPDRQPNNMHHVDLLVQKQNQKVSTRNAGTKHRDKYYSLHTTGWSTQGMIKGCHLWPYHLPHPP